MLDLKVLSSPLPSLCMYLVKHDLNNPIPHSFQGHRDHSLNEIQSPWQH